MPARASHLPVDGARIVSAVVAARCGSALDLHHGHHRVRCEGEAGEWHDTFSAHGSGQHGQRGQRDCAPWVVPWAPSHMLAWQAADGEAQQRTRREAHVRGGGRGCVTNLHSLAHRGGGHRRPVVAFSSRCHTAVACSRDRIRRSLRTPVRHAASGQMVGVNRATARSAVVRPVAARATVCGHGVRGRVLGSVVPALAMAGSSGGRAGFVAWGGATSPRLCATSLRVTLRGW